MSLLQITDLSVTLPIGEERRAVLRNLDLHLAAGEALGIVGESGSGKSMTARAIARLLPRGAESTGSIRVRDNEVLDLADSALRSYQSSEIAMIFQDPRVHINPVRTVGDFLTEGLIATRKLKKAAAERRAVELLADVGIPDGERRLRQFPHQLSGGLLQRVMIAAALACEPEILLADEPTTALDVSTQSDVVSILNELRRGRDMALIFITHDLELAAAICDRIAVMYAGEVVEVRPSADLVKSPRHPYSAGLLNARPDIRQAVPRLRAIPGRPLAAFEAGSGCAFSDRCDFHADACTQQRPTLEGDQNAQVRCIRAGDLDLSAPARDEEQRHV